MSKNPNPKIQAALDLLAGCAREDFAALALLAADQAGMCENDQEDLRHALFPNCRNCGVPIGDFAPSAKTSKIVSHNRECEECHDSLVRQLDHQRRLDAYESRGDYLRDQAKDER